MSKPKTLAFTTKYKGKSNVLVNEVGISVATSKKPQIKVKAIWDTGATNSVITKFHAAALGLKPVGKTNTKGVHGTKIVNTFLIDLYLPNTLKIEGLRVTECDALNSPDIGMLLGMDVIGSGDFAVTHHNGLTVFSFRYPSAGVIDFVNNLGSIGKGAVAQRKKVGRNDPCPCGSGKKYKQCHGKS